MFSLYSIHHVSEFGTLYWTITQCALLLLLRAFIQCKFARATNALQHATQIHMVTMQVHEIHTYYAVCGVMKSARGLF